MAATKRETKGFELLEASAFALSLWFVYSVISNAQDLVALDIKNAPASYALWLAILIVLYSWYRRKRLSTWCIVTLTVLATATAIWMFGL